MRTVTTRATAPVTSGIVASLEQTPAGGTTVLRIRALGSAGTREVLMPSCQPFRLVASDRFVLSGCGVLYDARADRVAAFRIQSHGLTGVGDRWVAYGRTVYDTEPPNTRNGTWTLARLLSR